MSNEGFMPEPYVYGACCCWHGALSSTKRNSMDLPGCPHCGGVLLQVDNEQEWWRGAREHEDSGHPGYVGFIKWIGEQPRCFKDITVAKQTYETTTGKFVTLT